jgi:hypothetical protein
MAKGGENTILEGINETRKPREQQLGRKSAGGGWGLEERKRKNLPSSPNNHTTGGKKPHKGGKFFLPREKRFTHKREAVNLSFGKNIISPLNYQSFAI